MTGKMTWPTVALAIVLAMALLPAKAQAADTFKGFRGDCRFAQQLQADPMRKTEHLHDFFGFNGTIYNDITDEELLAGPTMCRRPLDTSMYWSAAIKRGDQILQPTRSGFYFQTLGGLNPTNTIPFPIDFRMVTTNVKWACGIHTGPRGGQAAPGNCATNKGVAMVIKFPECWDGEGLRADGTHNVVHARKIDGTLRCPSTHPKQLPTLKMFPDYPNAGPTGGAWSVSMGHDEWGPYTAQHANFINGFPQATMDMLVKNCINRTINRPDYCNVQDGDV